LSYNQEQSVAMSGFFEEVQRRKVYRVAVAYIIVAAGIIQLASAAFPAWELPNWALRLVIVLLLIGFPIALILAWAFDVTAEGIKATAIAAPGTHRRRNIVMLVATGIMFSAAAGFFLLPGLSARKIDKSIAVLPFENLSAEQENAYFADGIQDDILTNLSKIGDLKVISRTSVMGYRGKTQSVREIGKALGVANILEGSVRRSGNKVRVNVQLIDATNDKHMWAEDYDGELTDVFKIQTDLAREIASALQAKLSPSEKAQMNRKPTENSEAYLAYMRAHDMWSKAVEDLGKLKEGEALYQRAIDLDPNFALAFARYSQLESWIVHSFQDDQERAGKARTLAERALALQPDLPEAHLARGFVQYYIDNDFDAAGREFEIAQRGLPNEGESYLALGAIQRRQGKWPESNASLEKAASLNPKDPWVLQNLAINYEVQRNWDAAEKTIDRALAANPTGLGPLQVKSKLAIEARGDLSVAQASLRKLQNIPLPPELQAQVAKAHIGLAVLQRNFAAVLEEAEALSDSTLTQFPGALCEKYTYIGAAKKILGDAAGARAALAKAKDFAEQTIQKNPTRAEAQASLAEVLAWADDKEGAMAAIARAQTILPETKDAFDGPGITARAAEIHAIFGDAATAVALLDALLQRPSPVSIPVLKLNPVWDPIRNDPRFQALIDKYSAKA
jgi:TolB-like protein/Tfp pilus assembly protein PilF